MVDGVWFCLGGCWVYIYPFTAVYYYSDHI